MFFRYPPNQAHRFWLSPVALGVLLILVGLLVFAAPQLLAYFVAGIFVLIGCALIGVGWSLRRSVTYHRLDESQQTSHDANGP